jgi:hypothetical protein
MYKSIADGFKVINATEGLKGFTLVSYKTFCYNYETPSKSCLLSTALPKGR